MTGIRHPEWRDELETTRYPFADTATLTSDNGNILSEFLFIDATLYPIGATLPLRLSRVDVTSSRITIYVSDANDVVTASAGFSTNSIPDNLKLVDSYGRTVGLFVSTAIRLSTLLGLPAGTHLFSEEATSFVLSVCTPLPSSGVEGILLSDGTVMSGDVVLIADDGIVFTHTQVTQPSMGPYYDETVFEQVKIDVVGDPLFRRRLCTDSDQFSTPRFIERICFSSPEILAVGELSAIEAHTFCVGPDEYGNVKIIAGNQDAVDSVLRIYPVDEGMMIRAVGEKTKE